jgi:hypothetical protein
MHKYSVSELEFLVKEGIGYTILQNNKKTIKDLVNGYLLREDVQQEVKNRIIKEIKKIQKKGIAIFTL